MQKLFILPNDGNPYADEVQSAVARRDESALTVELRQLDIGFLERNSVDVVISTGLSREWYYVLKGLNIVTITLGERDRYYELADIVVDCKHYNPKRYFMSEEHSICNNPDFDFNELTNLIKKLEWDSKFFGFNVAFLSCMHLTENIYNRIERFIREEKIRLVEYLCNCHDARSVRVAERKNFHFTDIRLQFHRPIREELVVKLPAGFDFGLASADHIPQLRKIARCVYLDSRYHFDSNFDQEKIAEFYQSWVEKGVRGQFDHECWCLFSQGDPVAFTTVRYGKNNSAVIGLVGVDEGMSGQGLGKRMLSGVFSVLNASGVKNVSVVTQGRNYGAQNLYQSVGFRTKRTQLWYHKWI